MLPTMLLTVVGDRPAPPFTHPVERAWDLMVGALHYLQYSMLGGHRVTGMRIMDWCFYHMTTTELTDGGDGI